MQYDVQPLILIITDCFLCKIRFKEDRNILVECWGVEIKNAPEIKKSPDKSKIGTIN